MTMNDLRTELLVDGEWISTQTTIPVFNPGNGEIIAKVSLSNEQLETKAIEAAERSAKSWANTPPRLRAEILRKAYELMIRNVDRLAHLISSENGKILSDAKNEVIYAAEFFRWFSEEAVRINGEFRKAPSGDKQIIVTRQPVGVSLLITPWNFPAAMATRKLGPALAAGCTVLLKPATETPLTALAIVELLNDAGLPKGVVNVILPINVGDSIGKLIDNPILRNISFTGSTFVGKIILKRASQRVLRCSMELGGNAPFLVLKGADVDSAVAGAMIAKMRNGGAACTSANRFYVHKDLVEEFKFKFAKEMAALTVGLGTDLKNNLGSSVSINERNKISDLVNLAIEHGGKVVTGGGIPNLPGAFYDATVMEVDSKNPILQNEIFGPVAPIVTISSDEEAVLLANDSEAGLISYVYASNFIAALKVAEALESGMVAINRGVISDPAAPFGGVKQSGIGREGGFDGINEFLETKYIGTNF